MSKRTRCAFPPSRSSPSRHHSITPCMGASVSHSARKLMNGQQKASIRNPASVSMDGDSSVTVSSQASFTMPPERSPFKVQRPAARSPMYPLSYKSPRQPESMPVTSSGESWNRYPNVAPSNPSCNCGNNGNGHPLSSAWLKCWWLET